MSTLLFSHLCQRNLGNPSLTPPTFCPPGILLKCQHPYTLQSFYLTSQAKTLLPRAAPACLVFTVGLFKVPLTFPCYTERRKHRLRYTAVTWLISAQLTTTCKQSTESRTIRWKCLKTIAIVPKKKWQDEMKWQSTRGCKWEVLQSGSVNARPVKPAHQWRGQWETWNTHVRSTWLDFLNFLQRYLHNFSLSVRLPECSKITAPHEGGGTCLWSQ